MSRHIMLMLLLIFHAESLSNNAPTVTTNLGLIKGSVLTSWTGQRIFAFRGIRYAEPPVDGLRFKAAVPAKSWNITYDGTQDAPVCPQPRDKLKGISASEDCLFLNVYTKPGLLHRAKVPVIVFLHPGSLFARSARSSLVSPEYLLDHDVVLVTLNYRLGALGFFSTGDGTTRGSLGYEDQVEALKWVNRHISAFGGDAQRVTLVGCSAGSTAALLHMVSPLSTGLFHRVVAMSGALTSPWVVSSNHADLAKNLGVLLGCPESPSKVLVECLQRKRADEIANTYYSLQEWGSDPFKLYGAVVEPGGFLESQPLEALRTGNFSHVPVVIGLTANEFESKAEGIMKNTFLRESFAKNFSEVAPIIFYYERRTEKSHRISESLLRHYFDGKKILEAPERANKMFNDGIVGYHVQETAKALAKYSREPVYFYRFSYPGRFSYYYNRSQSLTEVAHMDDMLYLFPSKEFGIIKPSDPEASMVRSFTSFLVNFAYSGDPTPSVMSEKWQSTKPDSLKYLDIGSELSMKTGLPSQDRLKVWENIFPTD